MGEEGDLVRCWPDQVHGWGVTCRVPNSTKISVDSCPFTPLFRDPSSRGLADIHTQQSLKTFFATHLLFIIFTVIIC